MTLKVFKAQRFVYIVMFLTLWYSCGA